LRDSRHSSVVLAQSLDRCDLSIRQDRHAVGKRVEVELEAVDVGGVTPLRQPPFRIDRDPAERHDMLIERAQQDHSIVLYS